jgi:ribosomal-protein-alanine N-acetyltransferase
MIEARQVVRQATPQDHGRLANLVYFESHVHRHLDWRTPLDWLGAPEYWIAEQDGLLAGAFACPPDPERVAWIRLFTHSHLFPLQTTWQVLWDTAREAVGALPGATIAAISLHSWFEALLLESSFALDDRIVTLEYTRGGPEPGNLPGIQIRRMTPADLPAVAALDAAAFGLLWQNSEAALYNALRQAGLATLAERDGQVVAYQISTQNPFSLHLARLATAPNLQGQGIGLAIVQDLIRQAHAIGLRRLTVNTQSQNRASLALYEKIGFTRTGEQYPVYTYPG